MNAAKVVRDINLGKYNTEIKPYLKYRSFYLYCCSQTKSKTHLRGAWNSDQFLRTVLPSQELKDIKTQHRNEAKETYKRAKLNELTTSTRTRRSPQTRSQINTNTESSNTLCSVTRHTEELDTRLAESLSSRFSKECGSNSECDGTIRVECSRLNEEERESQERSHDGECFDRDYAEFERGVEDYKRNLRAKAREHGAKAREHGRKLDQLVAEYSKKHTTIEPYWGDEEPIEGSNHANDLQINEVKLLPEDIDDELQHNKRIHIQSLHTLPEERSNSESNVPHRESKTDKGLVHERIEQVSRVNVGVPSLHYDGDEIRSSIRGDEDSTTFEEVFEAVRVRDSNPEYYRRICNRVHKERKVAEERARQSAERARQSAERARQSAEDYERYSEFHFEYFAARYGEAIEPLIPKAPTKKLSGN